MRDGELEEAARPQHAKELGQGAATVLTTPEVFPHSELAADATDITIKDIHVVGAKGRPPFTGVILSNGTGTFSAPGRRGKGASPRYATVAK